MSSHSRKILRRINNKRLRVASRDLVEEGIMEHEELLYADTDEYPLIDLLTPITRQYLDVLFQVQELMYSSVGVPKEGT